MGAAGDMLSAALFELLDDKQKTEFLQKINGAGIPGVAVSTEPSVKCGITGTHFKVTVNGEEEGGFDPSTKLRDRKLNHHDHEHEHVHEHEQAGVPEALEGPQKISFLYNPLPYLCVLVTATTACTISSTTSFHRTSVLTGGCVSQP